MKLTQEILDGMPSPDIFYIYAYISFSEESGASMSLMSIVAYLKLRGFGDATVSKVRRCLSKLEAMELISPCVSGNTKTYKTNNGSKPKHLPKKIKTKEEMQVECKQRKQAFVDDLRPYLDKYGKDMLNRFFLYWTEMNKSSTKMRFESEKTFEIGLRLNTWYSRENQNYGSKRISNQERAERDLAELVSSPTEDETIEQMRERLGI